MNVDATQQLSELNQQSPWFGATNADAEQSGGFAGLLFLFLTLPQQKGDPTVAINDGLMQPNDPGDAPTLAVEAAKDAPLPSIKLSAPPSRDNDTWLTLINFSQALASDPSIEIGFPSDVAAPVAASINAAPLGASDAPGQLAAAEVDPSELLDGGMLGEIAPLLSAAPHGMNIAENSAEKKARPGEAPADDGEQRADPLIDRDAGASRPLGSINVAGQTAAPQASTVQIAAPIELTPAAVELKPVAVARQPGLASQKVAPEPAAGAHATVGSVAEAVSPDRPASDSRAQSSAGLLTENESATDVGSAGKTLPAEAARSEPRVANAIPADGDSGASFAPETNRSQAAVAVHPSAANQREQRPDLFAAESKGTLPGVEIERPEGERHMAPNFVAGVPTAQPRDATERADGGALPWRTTVDRLAGDITSQVRMGSQGAEIQLDPPELGKIDIALRFEDGKLHARITADSMDARKLLESHLPELRQALSVQRIDVADMQVNQGGWNSGGNLMQGYQQSPQGRQEQGWVAGGDGAASAGPAEARTRESEIHETHRVSMWA